MRDELLRLAVENALAAPWQANVLLEADETADFSERTHLHRFHIHSTRRPLPATVIVKQPRGGVREETGDDARDIVAFFNEWASLQLLTELGGEPVAPRLYCGDV